MEQLQLNLLEELPHFTGWDNIAEGYYTKTTLSKEYRLKPINENDHDATLKARGGGRWKDFVLYHIDNTTSIKRRKITLLEATDKNIAEALYTINKSAKKSRDTKSSNYNRGNHQVVGASKTRQNKLYDLKDMVITKLLKDSRIDVIGYHTQESYDGDTNYLMLLELEGYTFHLPSNKQQVDHLELLGEIGIVPAERTKAIKVNFYEAEKLLNHYIDKPINTRPILSTIHII